jgi:hypothetical protein
MLLGFDFYPFQLPLRDFQVGMFNLEGLAFVCKWLRLIAGLD